MISDRRAVELEPEVTGTVCMWGDEWRVLGLNGGDGQGKNWRVCLVFCQEARGCQGKAGRALARWATAPCGIHWRGSSRWHMSCKALARLACIYVVLTFIQW